MPIVESSSFRTPWYFRQGDIQTILPRLLRPYSASPFTRERVDTPDGDFLDLDWIQRGQQRLAIVSHGLEGSSLSPYIAGMASKLSESGFDVLAWNFRGCSGEASRTKRGYHSGKWDDLRLVVNHVVNRHRYSSIALVGFSVGANITLLYLGNMEGSLPNSIGGTVVYCAPVELGQCALHMGTRRNSVYMRWFLGLLREKLIQQGVLSKGSREHKDFRRIKNFLEFDSRYTAPLFDFSDAKSYWENASSARVLDGIRVPTLLVNPLDDPMLSPECFPFEAARRSSYLYLETPHSGGHVGFLGKSFRGEYWSETRAVDFLNEVSGRADSGIARDS